MDPTGELAESFKLPSVPDYFDESGTEARPAAEGSPVVIPPPEMIGFDEPAAPGGAPAQPVAKPDEPAASRPKVAHG